MAVHLAVIHPHKIEQEFIKTGLLLWRSIVDGIAARVQAAYVTNANRVRVVSFAMSAWVRNRPTAFYRAVALDNVVIADVGKTSSEVHLLYFLGSESAAWAVRRTVNNYFIDESHSLIIVLS